MDMFTRIAVACVVLMYFVSGVAKLTRPWPCDKNALATALGLQKDPCHWVVKLGLIGAGILQVAAASAMVGAPWFPASVRARAYKTGAWALIGFTVLVTAMFKLPKLANQKLSFQGRVVPVLANLTALGGLLLAARGGDSLGTQP
jgi:hypothetical protein